MAFAYENKTQYSKLELYIAIRYTHKIKVYVFKLYKKNYK